MSFRHFKIYEILTSLCSKQERERTCLDSDTIWNDYMLSLFYTFCFMFFHMCFFLRRIGKNINTIVITVVPTKQRTS